jgi:signal recognition particle subunit SRP54
MAELSEIEKIATPKEVLLVADSLTGQEAVTIAEKFSQRVSLSGIVLTRTEGDGRGGAALSMRHVTGVPIKFLGTGEGTDKIEAFDAQRIAGRILGMGDVVGLVEKAAETLDAEKAEKMAARMKKGQFTLEDMAEQLKQMQRMGGMAGVLNMLPGNLLGKKAKQLGNLGMDDKELIRQAAIVSSMTQAEKDNPKLLNASRKKRVAAGSGTQVQDVNKLIKVHRQMADMMKKLGKGGLSGMMGALGGGLGGNMGGLGGNLPADLPADLPGDLPTGNQMPDFDQLSKQLGGSSFSDPFSGGGKPNFPPKKK